MRKLIVLTMAALCAMAGNISAAEHAETTILSASSSPVVGGATGASEAPDSRFTTLDKDGDGSLLQSDIPTAHDLSTDLFASFDTDQDQRISSAEFAVYAGNSNQDTEEEEEAAE